MKIHTLVILAIALAGCSSPGPTIQSGEDAEVTYDGLHRIDNARFGSAWVYPDIDFSHYSKVIPAGAEFQFRPVDRGTRSMRGRSSDTEFWISDANQERLIEETTAIFAEELANSTRFEITDTKGDNVIIIGGVIHDIVSTVPPEQIGRGDIFLSSVGEATIVIQVVDSMSGKVIFRAAERRAAQRPGGQAMRSSSVTTWAEVRRLMRLWATTLREGLDSLPVEN